MLKYKGSPKDGQFIDTAKSCQQEISKIAQSGHTGWHDKNPQNFHHNYLYNSGQNDSQVKESGHVVLQILKMGLWVVARCRVSDSFEAEANLGRGRRQDLVQVLEGHREADLK